MATLQMRPPPPELPPRLAPRGGTALPGHPVDRPPLRSWTWCVVRWCPLAGAVVWAAHAARLLGLAPLRLRRRHGTLRATPSPAWARLGYVYATFTNICLILMYASDGKKITQVSGLLFFMKITINAITVTIAVLGAPGRMLAIVYCLDRADKIILQLRDRRMNFLQKASSSMCYLGIVALISVVETVTFNWLGRGLMDAFRIHVVMSKVFVWMFMATALQTQAALTAARRELEHLLTDMEAPSSSVSSSAQWQRVRRASRALGEASALQRRLADAHRAPLIMHLIVLWFALFYNSNLLVFSAKEQLNVEKIICCEITMSIIINLLVLVEPGHRMNDEATLQLILALTIATEHCLKLLENSYKRNVNVCVTEMAHCLQWTFCLGRAVLYFVMRRCGELGVRAWRLAAAGAGPAAPLRLLAAQLAAAPLAAPVYMPLAFHPFDRTLLFKVFGSVITYLVIFSPKFSM